MKAVSSFRCRDRMAGRRSGFGVRHWSGVAILSLAILMLMPSTASADGVFTPFIGVSFGGDHFGQDQTERVTTYGISLAGMAGGIFGFELDFAQTAEAKTDTVFSLNSRSTTVMGNIIVGIPLGAVRPYASGGLGWLRNKVNGEGAGGQIEAFTSDGVGINFGGGIMGFFTDHVGARVDIRYIRALTAGESLFDFNFENFSFVRFTGGVALRF